jgi:hypothetical protein
VYYAGNPYLRQVWSIEEAWELLTPMTLFLGGLFVYGIEDSHARGGGSMAYPCVEVLEGVCTAAWVSKNAQAMR